MNARTPAAIDEWPGHGVAVISLDFELRWGEHDRSAVIEVYDASKGKLLGQYRRHVDSVKFYEV